MTDDDCGRRRETACADPGRLSLCRILCLLAVLLSGVPADPAWADTLEEQTQLCMDCHHAETNEQDPAVPSLGGQPELFVMYQLHFFRSAQRDNPEMNAVMAEKSDDDLRALAGFVASLPAPSPPEEGLDEDRYRRGAELAKKHKCYACHNADYSGRDQMPRLAGQREPYLLKVLKDYRSGARVGTQAAMADIVQPLSDADWADLSHFFAYFRTQ